MINRFLRRLTVRARIFAAFVILVALLALALPLTVTSQRYVVGRLQQISEVEARAHRLLLLASTRVESSRVNLMRYVQDYAPSAYEALDDVGQAAELLQQAQGVVVEPEQQATIGSLLTALEDYRGLVGDVESARSEGQEQDVSRRLFQAYRLGNDIGQRIEQVVADSEAQVDAANEAVYAQAQRRLLLLGSAYLGAVVLGLVLAALIERSITQPIDRLRSGAESLRSGNLETTIPVDGSDELSVLSRAFNQMAGQVHELIGTLEHRVADRTQDLERRAVQLGTAAEVGQAVAAILDLGTLTSRVVEVVRERFDLYYVALFLLDETGRYAALEAGTGEAGRQMREQGHRLEVGGLSMVGAACAMRQARIAQDVGRESVRFDNPLLPETRTEVALPLIAGNRVLGALDAQSSLPAAFSPEDIAVLQLVANEVAVAIENARLFTEVQAALQAERRAYAEVSRAGWAQWIEAQSVTGYTSDQRGLTPVRGRWEPDPGPPEALEAELDRIVRDGQPVLAPDQPETLMAPIRVRDQVVGVIDAHKPEGTGRWTDEELALMQMLADQLGAALDSARLYDDVQRRAARERLTAEVTGRLRERLQVEKVLEAAALELGEMFGATEVKVRLAPTSD